MRTYALCGWLALGFLTAGECAATAAKVAKPSAAVAAAMDEQVRAYEAKDIAALSRCFAHDADMVSFGTDAAERWVGWEPARAAIERYFAAVEKQKIVSRDRVVKVSKTGETAWVSELWDMDVVSEGQPVSLKGLRITAVLERRQGRWVIVQSHASVGLAGQAVKY